MSTKKKQTTKNPKTMTIAPYKEVQFEQFLKLIGDEGVSAHWSDIANVIGVSKDTITSWKRHPKAQEAMARGIRESIKNMETYGKRDWRMWREKLKMLGLVEVQRQEHTGEGGGAMQFILKVDGYRNPRHVDHDASPGGGDPRPDEIQGADMAQTLS